MPDADPIYRDFLGAWELIVESCQYEQGEPPRAGHYRILDEGGRLSFIIDWTDQSGERHQVTFAGVPDGRPAPFAGGELADALCVTAGSRRELTTTALFRGTERMVAQRQLSAGGDAMRVVQLVRLAHGKRAVNTSVYRRIVVQ